MATGLNSFHGFLQLPKEMKLMILRHNLVFDYVHHKYNYRSIDDMMAVALVSKDLKELAYTVYCGENTFLIDHNDVIYFKPFRFYVPSATIGTFLRQLQVKLTVMQGDGPEYNLAHGWQYLLADMGNITQNNRSGCPRLLPRLISLSLSLKVRCSGDIGSRETELQCIVRQLRNRESTLHAQKIEMEIAVIGGGSYGAASSRRYEEVLGKALKDLIVGAQEEGVGAGFVDELTDTESGKALSGGLHPNINSLDQHNKQAGPSLFD